MSLEDEIALHKDVTRQGETNMRLERDYNETEKDNEKVTRLTKTMMSD